MLGGYGYLRDYSIEQYVRDTRVHEILEGECDGTEKFGHRLMLLLLICFVLPLLLHYIGEQSSID